mgnify:CR=1 FL=1
MIDFRKPIRKTLTISADMVQSLNLLKPEDKVIAIDALFNHFFFGEELFSKDYPDAVTMFLSCSAPQIRLMDSKFNNPMSKKRNS